MDIFALLITERWGCSGPLECQRRLMALFYILTEASLNPTYTQTRSGQQLLTTELT